MWDQSLVIVSVVSAGMSTALGVVFLVTLNRLGTIAAIEDLGETEPTVSVIMPCPQ